MNYKHAVLIRRFFAAIMDGVCLGIFGSVLAAILVCLYEQSTPTQAWEIYISREGVVMVITSWLFLSCFFTEIFSFSTTLALGLYVVWSIHRPTSELCQGIFLSALLPLLVSIIYHGLMESLPRHATLGKLALGVFVSRADKGNLSFTRAALRYLAKGLSILTLGLGYLMAFNDAGQTLHDKITGCIVLKKESA